MNVSLMEKKNNIKRNFKELNQVPRRINQFQLTKFILFIRIKSKMMIINKS